MSEKSNSVKLDEVLKFLFTTSKGVLLGLLNAIFEEHYTIDEVDLEVTNNEEVEKEVEKVTKILFDSEVEKRETEKDKEKNKALLL